MKNILNIFKTDLNNIRKKRAAIVVIVALMILPSMYAWFNILPSWDPYANTEGVSVAVVNKDEGANVEGEEINVGNEIVLSLLDNKKLGWQFVDEEEALKGVEHGDYYASIIIPENFSQRLSSVLDEEPEKPILDYYINEKINAIAPKVTSAGASGIVEQIESGFVKVANEAIFTAFNDIGIELETNRESIERLRDSIYQMEDDLPEIERLLGVAGTDLTKVEDSVGKANDGVKRAEDISKDAERMSERLEEMLKESDKSVRTYVPIIKQDLRLAQTVIQEIPSITRRISQKGTDVDRLLNGVVDSTAKIDETTKSLQKLADLLEKTNERLTEDRKLEDLIDHLNEQSNKMEDLKTSVESAIETLEKGEHIGVDIIDHINQTAEDVEKQLGELIDIYEKTIIPGIEDKMEEIRKNAPLVKEKLEEAHKIGIDLQEQVEQWVEEGGRLDLEKQKEILERLQPLVGNLESHVGTLEHVLGHLDSIFSSGRFSEQLEKITALHERVIEIQESIDHGLELIEKGENIDQFFWEKLNGLLIKVNDQLEHLTGDGFVNISKSFEDAVKKLEEEKKKVQDKLADLEKAAENASKLTGDLLETVKNPEKTLKMLRDINARITEGQDAIASVVDLSERLQKTFDDGLFLDGVDRIESLQNDLQTFKSDILRVVDNARDTKKSAGETLVKIEDKSREMDRAISDVWRFIDRDLMPKYEEASNKANNALKEGNKILTKANTYFPRINDLLGQVDEGVVKGKDGLAKANEAFPEAKEKITEIAKRVRILEEKGDLDQIIRLLKNDPSAESEFFADPIVLNEHELFPIPNYGSAMAPFFTAMSLWVGGLILVSSLIVDVPNKHLYKSYETYFGRILTFWAIGIVQALIVTVGNMILLKTFVAHKILFVLFGFLISIVFVTIIYTFVSVFGNSGKVMAIILLVMQLGASGGTFPIQMTPEFFQKIHQFLPFTHALGLFREAVGGVIWPVAFEHIAWLLGYMAIFLFIGIRLKERINKRSDKFLAEARESEIIL